MPAYLDRYGRVRQSHSWLADAKIHVFLSWHIQKMKIEIKITPYLAIQFFQGPVSAALSFDPFACLGVC